MIAWVFFTKNTIRAHFDLFLQTKMWSVIYVYDKNSGLDLTKNMPMIFSFPYFMGNISPFS